MVLGRERRLLRLLINDQTDRGIAFHEDGCIVGFVNLLQEFTLLNNKRAWVFVFQNAENSGTDSRVLGIDKSTKKLKFSSKNTASHGRPLYGNEWAEISMVLGSM